MTLARCSALLLLFCTKAALAHAPVASEVRTTLEPPPALLAPLRIQLHETLAPQLVVENPTHETLEILDAQDRAFLRIDAAGVQADMAAIAWYQSFVPGGVPAPLEAADKQAPARWVRISGAPSWGWFDPRLRSRHEVTKALRARASTTKLGAWRIPLQYGDTRTELSGAFLYEPPPAGYFETRLRSPAEFAPGLRVKLIPGTPPALLLENNSTRTVTVLGAAGEPMLRLKENRIYANLRSAGWRASGRAFTTEAAQARAPDNILWMLVARGQRFSWLEPRAGPPQPRPSADTAPGKERKEVRRWKIPVLVDGQEVSIDGTVEWVPAKSHGKH